MVEQNACSTAAASFLRSKSRHERPDEIALVRVVQSEYDLDPSDISFRKPAEKYPHFQGKAQDFLLFYKRF